MLKCLFYRMMLHLTRSFTVACCTRRFSFVTGIAERTGSPELTERELDVLRRIVAGRSNKEIAADLGIAEGTVKTHVNHVLDKLGVHDRTQAVTTALKR